MTGKLASPGAGFLYQESPPESIFTPEDFTHEHRLILDTARNFAEKEVRPKSQAMEEEDYHTVRELLYKAGELGLLAHSIPEAYGGLGLDKISKGIVGEALGATGGYGVAHSNHTCIATLPITYFGTPEQKEKYLPKLASGDYIGAYCLTEPEAGSDALASKTTAVLNEAGTHYILNGAKLYITSAGFADTFIVYAKVDGEHFSSFIVEKSFPGLKLGQEEKKMGIKGSSTRPVFFEDCMVPVENLLGQVGKGHVIALNVLNLGRFNLGSACMGASKFGLKLAVDYTRERRQFGRAIAEFPASKEKIAKMAMRIYAAESLQYRTACLLEDALGDFASSFNFRQIGSRLAEYATECAVCKVYGSETLHFVADEALQLHGGAGYIKEYGIEKMYRDARINRIFEGTNEINRLLIPTHFLRKAKKGILPLEDIVNHAFLELENEGVYDCSLPLDRERIAVQAIRRLFLVCIGLSYKAFGKELVHEQEILMKLADLGIYLYAAESALLRTLKAVHKHGMEKEALKVVMTQALVDDCLLDVEALAKKIVLSTGSGATAHHLISRINNMLSGLYLEGTVQRTREIADAVITSGQYVS